MSSWKALRFLFAIAILCAPRHALSQEPIGLEAPPAATLAASQQPAPVPPAAPVVGEAREKPGATASRNWRSATRPSRATDSIRRGM